MDDDARSMSIEGKTLLFLVSEDWYFCSHRLTLARAAKRAGAKVAVACRVAEHGAEIEAEGFDLYPLPLDRSRKNFLADIGTLLKIRALYASLRPDIVHHVAMKPALYGSIAAWMTGVPAVVNALGGLGYLFINRSLPVRVLRVIVVNVFRVLFNRRNTVLIVQNPDDFALFRDRIGVSPDRIRTVRGSGIDITAFAPTPEPPGPTIVALCVSRMLWDKGIGELVDAAHLLSKKHVPIRIKLAGPTDENPASIPQSVLREWEKEGVVDILGPQEDIAGLYRNAHVAVLPSYREGLPKSLLEAAACGRPMVSTDVPGCREICRHNETGLLAPVKSVEPLASALERLALDPALRARLGAAARKAAETEFAETIVHGETLAIYDSIAVG